MKKGIIMGAILLGMFTLLSFLFIRTSNDSLSRHEYIKWIESENNGHRKSHSSPQLLFELTYCPIDYIICKETRSEEISREGYNDRLKDLKGLEYFRLRMKRKDSNEEMLAYHLEGGQTGYNNRVEYLSYGFEENLLLIENNLMDTLRPALCHFERTYGVTPYIDFLVAFPESETKDPHKVFLLNDNVFGEGIVRFDLNKNELIKLPKLLLK